MLRPCLGSALALLVGACTSNPPEAKKETAPPAAPVVAKSAADGWVEWLASDANALNALQTQKGWTSYYNRRYRDSIAAFSENDRVGLGRAHLELARVELALMRLLASARLEYFQERAKLGESAPKLKYGAFHRAVAAILAGKSDDAALAEPGLSKSHVRLAKTLAKPCGQAGAEPADAWTVVSQALRCPQMPPCPAGQVKAPAELEEPWKTRVERYYAALCAPVKDLQEASLLELATTPAEEETTAETKAGDIEIKGVIAHYDPIALFALSRFHLRHAKAAFDASKPGERALASAVSSLLGEPSPAAPETAGPAAPEALIFSSGRELESSAATADAVITEASAMTSKLTAGLDAAAGPQRRAVKQMSLESTYADAMVRRAANAAMKKGDCESALRLYRGTLDLRVTEQVTYRNEPSFQVELAAAALCLRRSTEAIGALRAVRAGFAEAEGALVMVNSLTVVRGMGGSSVGPKTE